MTGSSPIILITGVVIIPPSPLARHFLPNKVCSLLSLCLVWRSVQVTAVIYYLTLKILIFKYQDLQQSIQSFPPRLKHYPTQ